MVSFPGLKKDLCGALKKAIGMECRGRHIPAVPQWLPSLHSHTAPIWRRPSSGHSCMFSSGSAWVFSRWGGGLVGLPGKPRCGASWWVCRRVERGHKPDCWCDCIQNTAWTKYITIMFECMIKYVYFNISTLIMVQMCLFYAIEKKMNSECINVYHQYPTIYCIGFPSTPLY